MHRFQTLLKSYLRDILIVFRHEEGCTQEKMAARLRISSRSYSDLERGKTGFSAVTLMLFLSFLPDDKILETVHSFRSLLNAAEKKEAA